MKRCFALVLAACLCACAGAQSALSPHGDEANRIALLSRILFGGAALILLIVIAALWLAVRGPERARRALAQERSVWAGGFVFPIATLAVLLGYGVWLMREALIDDGRPALEIHVTGEQWWWRVSYRGSGGEALADANQIRIPVGRDIDIVLGSADVIHSFWVPSLGGKTDMIPGRSNRLRLKAERPGIYRGQCAEYCGGAHALMAFEVVAMPAEAFEQWLTETAGPAPEPETPQARQGREVFAAAGCGGCHAVRGTQAVGRIAPDLSRVGARRFLAAGALRNEPAEIARFVADPQAMKPGILMPPFANLDGEERAALAAYLVSLK